MTQPEHSNDYDWQPQPAAASLVREMVSDFLARNAPARALAARMRQETGTRFIDWVDSIETPRSDELRHRLDATGFSRRAVPGAPDRYVHERAILPPVVFDKPGKTRVGIKVDSIVDFLAAWQVTDESEIEGEPLAALRRILVWEEDDSELWIVERHGYRGLAIDPVEPHEVVRVLKHQESFQRRTRDWDVDDIGFDHVEQLIDVAVADLGADRACDLFFASERAYWQSKNRAAQVQKSRQDRLGLGWANHDHHTYRSSRRFFPRLIAIFEKLGCTCRERFYAGADAGWGAQVLEQPAAGITIFADLDLGPEEILTDFAHETLPDQDELGTVGLWCGLHGESILQSGLHHLECTFDFEALREQLQAAGVNTMSPFTTFPFLTQAFTVGERWPVSEQRLKKLVASGAITSAQATWFRMQGGAIGSHLENLERNDGYKGFNQQGISDIIARTDARNPDADVQHGMVGA